MYSIFWQLALFVRGQSFSVKTFDRSLNGCQVIREGAGNDFRGGLPCRRFLSPCLSPSRALVFSCAHYFQAPATQAMMCFNFKVCLTTYFCSLKEIKVVSHEFSQNQKIVTVGFPRSLGTEPKDCYPCDLKS